MDVVDLREKLVVAIANYLRLQRETLNGESAESLEVAVQCLESAFGINENTPPATDVPLEKIFEEHLQTNIVPEPTEEEMARASALKEEGNDLMRSDKLEDALRCYTEAIRLDPTQAVFYCNRAATFSKLNQHERAIDDCQRAITINPSYSKAFGRLGIAYLAMGMAREARDSYREACRLEPDNTSYQNNLALAEEKVAEMDAAGAAGGAAGGGLPGMPGFGPGGGLDFSQILSNPQVLNVATQMMSSPAIQEMMATMTGLDPAAAQNARNAPGGGAPDAAPAPGLEVFLRAGQQLADQISQSNPALVEQLRQQMTRNPQDGASAGDPGGEGGVGGGASGAGPGGGAGGEGAPDGRPDSSSSGDAV